MLPSLPPPPPPVEVPPPPKQPALVLLLKNLRLVVPLPFAALAIGALILALRFPAAPPLPLPEHGAAAPGPLEQWVPTTAVDFAARFATRNVLAKLKPLPGQKTEDCDPDLGEQPRAGACWMKTEVPPPCPEGKLWEDEKKCWRPVPKTARAPQSGEPRQGAVADP